MRFAITGHITVLSDIPTGGTDDNPIREKQTFMGSDFSLEEGGTRRDDEGATYHNGIWKASGENDMAVEVSVYDYHHGMRREFTVTPYNCQVVDDNLEGEFIFDTEESES